jgi:ribonuclease Z
MKLNKTPNSTPKGHIMKLYVFGTCSGTEPFPNRHHTAWALELDGRVYWFDAGESCAHTAHVMGVDLLSVSDIFISHPHMDHVGGLPHLLWTIRKLSLRSKAQPKFGNVSVYIANKECFDGVMGMLLNAEGKYQASYRTLRKRVTDGVICTQDGITVTARHNLHVQPTAEGYQSFSFLIEAQGKRIVYTGDLASLDEIEEFLADGCDLLLTETGHHSPTEICTRMAERNVGQICFLHHGRPIMQNFDTLLAECRAIIPGVIFCNDKDVFEI